MSDDTRQEAAIEWLTKRFYTEEAARMVAPTLLAAIDAKDPLRRPPGDEAVRAFLYAYDGALGHRGQKAMGGLIAALAIMRGETVTEFTSRTIDGVPTRVRYTEANPPPDAIEDRLAALEGRLMLNADQRAFMDRLSRSVEVLLYDTGKNVDAENLQISRRVAFPQPERAWPPADCFDSLRCGQAKLCLDLYPFIHCPHAGERA